MISKNLYFSLMARIAVIVVLSLGVGYFLFATKSILVAILCIVALLISAARLIWFVNSTNRKISFFFEAVKNNDSTLSFPSDSSNKTIRILNGKLNEVNRQIQQLKIDGQQKEQYFQTLLENVATGIITFNSKGFILHANRAGKKMLSADVLTHIKQLERIDGKLYQTIQRIRPNEHKLVSLPSELGVTELSINATPFKIYDDDLILLSIHDIKNELDAKELDSWLKLIRVLMHEIMNSIAPITSLSESLSKHFAKGMPPENTGEISSKSYEVLNRGLEVIRSQSYGLMQFVESYRKLTRLPMPDKKIFKVMDLLHQIKVLFESDGANINIAAIPENMEIYADESQLSQVLVNLTKNAIQATEHSPTPKISVMAKINGNHPEITVTDNGPGIPKDIIDEIFVPFFTTHENGSGIGLSVSKQIVRLHGGKIEVHSVPNRETTFTIIL
ncbi:MAG: PAS domain-containing sensor histidine kinase [Bacteroidales bacterium]